MDSSLLKAALQGAGPAEVRSVFTTLTRIAQRDKTAPAVEWMRDQLSADLERLAEPALEVAVQSRGPLATVLAEVLEQQGRPELVTRLHERFRALIRLEGDAQQITLSTRPVDIDESLSRLHDVLQGRAVARPYPGDTASIISAFGAASRLLLGWPQETDGVWIERPELQQMHAIATKSDAGVTALLGPPGVGKSALLARLGIQLAKENVAFLAIKADQLPRNVGSLADLDDWIGAPVPVVEALRSLAQERRTILLIDQLDALAELMDQHTSRLSALLRLIDAVSGVSNIQTLVSCREFEFRNDVRLSSIDADSINLDRPLWASIEPLFVARKIDTKGWRSEVKDVLRTPQHLAVFLRHLVNSGAAPDFRTYSSLLERVVLKIEREAGSNTVEAAEQIAAAMGEEEELTLATARFSPAWTNEISKLEAMDVLKLSSDRLSLTFRHQTVFDFLRARAFVRAPLSLSTYVLHSKQESLFVRPVLWSALHYLREADLSIFRREFGTLWMQQGLRAHIRYLLISFLGQLKNPDDQEARWLLPTVDDAVLRRKALAAMAGSPGWFSRLQGRLATVMSSPPQIAWEAVWLLQKAVVFDPERVLDLVSRYWVVSPGYEQHFVQVLHRLDQWTEKAISLAIEVLTRPNAAGTYSRILVEQIGKSNPEAAAVVVGRILQAQMDNLQRTLPPPPAAPQDNAESSLTGYIREREAAYGPLNRLLEDRDHAWHNLKAIALRAPRAFTENIWPWLLRVLDRLADKDRDQLRRYRGHSGLAFRHDDDDDFDMPLPSAIEAAIEAFAKTNPDAFLAFVELNSGSNLLVVHQLLMRGLAQIAPIQPGAALKYLLEDERRFAVGDYSDIHRETRLLIAALVPTLSDQEALSLEHAIRHWSLYRSASADDDAKTRFQRLKWTRQHRLRLLRAFPAGRLSESGRQLLREEERALPDTQDWDSRSVGGGFVASPMSSDQMRLASDAQIIALFDELTDDTEWSHPRRRWAHGVGGSIEASRAFADFAKAEPQRALYIIDKFRAGVQERPAGHAISALAGGLVPADDLIVKIHDLALRGFKSEVFVSDAARALAAIARRNKGLGDKTIHLLRGWITDWAPSPKSESRESSSIDEERESPRNLLWGYGAAFALPGGNYPVLEALTMGLLCREPTDTNEWLDLLEQHLDRREDPKVWQAMAFHLQFLSNAEPARVAKFVRALLAKNTGVSETTIGVRFVAHIQEVLSLDLLREILDAWINSSWPAGAQAAGEVAALRYFRRSESEMRRIVENYLDGVGYSESVSAALRLGVANTAAHAWREPPFRQSATEILTRVLPIAGAEYAAIVQSLFARAEPALPDRYSAELLRALTANPTLLSAGRISFLLDALQNLLKEGWEPQLVADVIEAVLRRADKGFADFSTSWAASSDELVELTLTLHRIEETRKRGLDLFERLMAVDAYGVKERLETLDRRPFETV